MVISVLILMMPDGASEKEVRLIGALALICVIAAPLAGAAKNVREFFASGAVGTAREDAATGVPDELIDALERQSAAEINEVLADKICDRFGLGTTDVSVRAQVTVEDGRVTLERVYVIFTGAAMWQDPRPVAEYVESLAGVPCEIAEG